MKTLLYPGFTARPAPDADSRRGQRPSPTELREMLRVAVLAPSSLNRQPWRFRIARGAVYLYADRSRALPATDPQNRELIMSCGAALFHLQLAVRHADFEPHTVLLPDPASPDLLAVVRPELSRRTLTPAEDQLYEAIAYRRTCRLAFADRPVSGRHLEVLRVAAAAQRARLHVFGAHDDRQRLTRLIAEGERMQQADGRVQRERAAWVRGGRGAKDGLPGYLFGRGTLRSLTLPPALRPIFHAGAGPLRPPHLAEEAPVLAVLTTERDDLQAQLDAGQALAHVLLAATTYGLAASFLNAPIQVSSLRGQVADLVESEHPQVLLRLGYGPLPAATPRRDLADVVTAAEGS